MGCFINMKCPYLWCLVWVLLLSTPAEGGGRGSKFLKDIINSLQEIVGIIKSSANTGSVIKPRSKGEQQRVMQQAAPIGAAMEVIKFV